MIRVRIGFQNPLASRMMRQENRVTAGVAR
jgi:hypothetical protein